MLKKILIGLIVLVGGFFGFAAMQPDTYTVTRKIQIQAPPAAVYPQLSSLKKFVDWSPWDKLDPALKRTFGKEEGVGATYAWEGNDEVGKGQMSITAAEPDKKVAYALEFKEPIASKASIELTIEGSGAPVTVTWTMNGNHNLMGKAMGVFMSMDQMIGDDFDRGLANLKAVSEKAASEVVLAPPPLAPPEANLAPAPESAAKTP